MLYDILFPLGLPNLIITNIYTKYNTNTKNRIIIKLFTNFAKEQNHESSFESHLTVVPNKPKIPVPPSPPFPIENPLPPFAILYYYHKKI